jgi:NADP-dependent 3-hydroxy acid dehydrogenase YdfG
LKTAIVTGSSKGVGHATVKCLLDNGYRVIAVSRNIERLKEIQSDNLEIYQLDITNMDGIKTFYNKYSDITLDLLVHNAGGGASPTYLINEKPENFHIAYAINVVAPMYMSQLFVPNMKKSDSPTIVFVSSLGGKYPYPSGGNYTNAKRGMRGLVDTMRLEYPEFNIKVTEICPGTIDTQTEKREKAITAEDMAETIRWVASLPSHVNINQIEISHVHTQKF